MTGRHGRVGGDVTKGQERHYERPMRTEEDEGEDRLKGR